MRPESTQELSRILASMSGTEHYDLVSAMAWHAPEKLEALVMVIRAHNLDYENSKLRSHVPTINAI